MSMATNYYYLNEDDCSAFIVLPPFGANFDDPKTLGLIGTALSERYPPYKFTVSTHGPYRDDSFVLIPVVGKMLEGHVPSGEGPFLQPPSFDLLREIGEFLYESFVANRPATLN